ncbi:MAG: hypothetical protein HY881_07040 [Deltaproteobacteria bacterium]|nr:hypothetical protein [Deltaproteobacteria bacterium]
MSNIKRSFIILILLFFIQSIVYTIFLLPLILTWGASENEINMPLVGDDLAPYTRSTRAISINAPVSEVWKWLIQLGADRGGFFSYAFIEKVLGYDTRDADSIVPKFQEMKVGRIVPGSLDDSKSIMKYNFPVVYVEPGNSFVLKGWGAFVLMKLNTEQTRLIVRTHGRELPSLKSKIGDFFETPLHYIMERRMLMGIKARSEAGSGVQLSSTSDILWFLGVFLSGVGIFLMVLMGRGIQRVLLLAIYGIIWLWPLLIFDPQPIYSMILLFVVAVTIVWLVFKHRLDYNRSNAADSQA